MTRVLVTGAGGFIGHHLVKRLKADGHWVRGVDIKLPEYEPSGADRFMLLDLCDPANAYLACVDVEIVYHLACDMGGIGYTRPIDFEQRLNNTRIDLNVIEAAKECGTDKFFYASSACVYNETLQGDQASALKESDAYPAQPDLTYGWVKLMGERSLLESEVPARIARFHNVYGELGSWDGGKEKAPAALCRKVALAKLRGENHIDIWGDGQQVRSFMYIDDCIEGILRLTASDYHEPINLGRDDAISVNDLATLIMDIAGVKLELRHDLSKPQGVRSRNSDNARLRKILAWEPPTSLHAGLEVLYYWINEQVLAHYGVKQS